MKKAVVILLTLIILCGAITGISYMTINEKAKDRILSDKDFENIDICNEDAIYFLNTGSSDAIVLQSQGHFAMIDAGEDNDNPRNFPELVYKGYEQEILDFLKKTAGDENGIVKLDFIIGTHSHSDHIGGFDTIIKDKSVLIDKAYLKEYHSESIVEHEVTKWDNQEVYDQMLEALNSRSVPIISEISSDPFKFGNFTLTILNTEYEKGDRKVGENDNSLVVLVEKDSSRALLTGDLDNLNHDEERIAELVGEVDLLKVGHHSYSHSTEKKFLKLVNPKMSIVTNSYEKSDKNTLRRITQYTDSSIAFSDDMGGICAVFKDNKITYTSKAGL